jgi:predicted ester cyclase
VNVASQGDAPGATYDEINSAVLEHFDIVAEGKLEAMDDNVTPDFLNNIRSGEEPLAARQPGPAGLRATSLWLRQTFADLRFEIHDIVIQDDRVAARVTMRARQYGTFLVYDDASDNGTDAFPSTGRTLAVAQTHWFRIRDGKIAEHDAGPRRPPTTVPLWLADSELCGRRSG